MLPDRLKQLRTERNLTQRAIAIGINITERNYQRFERGAVSPSHDAFIALASFFDVSLDYLVGRTDKQEVNR